LADVPTGVSLIDAILVDDEGDVVTDSGNVLTAN
jgi:hypothetical protein